MTKYKLIETTPISPDIISLRFAPLKLTQAFHYEAGQYINTVLENPPIAADSVLSLSIANASNQAHILEFHLRHDSKQKAALSFVEQLKHNKVIEITGPFGKMTKANLRVDKNLLLLAGGTGIAPFKALLEEILQQQSALLNHSISLWWGIRKPRDLYLLDFLKEIQNQYASFAYKIVLSTIDEIDEHENWPFSTGWLHEMLRDESAWTDVSNIQVYASGPFEMVKKCHATLLERGLENALIYSDML